ncbi:MAG TPA: PQQ-binding-like beta-propeller repeat protein [Bacteroidales bacterium]|nr:PQQ-binding-like beta-propeller repeat protein [Bacteroidales bacterium]
MEKWPDKGPDILLELKDLPATYSSVIVKNEIIYTTGIKDTLEIIMAIHPNGSTKWQTVYGKAWDKSFNHARSTPTIEGNNAYVISGRGNISCIDISNGMLQWSVDGHKKYEGSWGTWGIAESPLVVDDKVIYTPGGNRTTMVALDKENGETVWESPSLENKSAYTSPLLVERGDLKMIISVIADYVICVNADDGEILWSFYYKGINDPKRGGSINPVTPIVNDNEVFVTSGYNHVGIMLQMAEDFRSVNMKWKTNDLDVHHGGVVEVDGYLYGANYTSVVNGNWTCIDWDSGALKYEEKWRGKGSIIATDGFLICYDERRGHVGLVRITPEKFDIISEFRVVQSRGPHWSHPAIFNDKLYIRHNDALVVYSIGY